MASEDINVAIDYADRNQAVDVNPYIARTSDDNEDAFDGSERESFVSKPMPQADDRGNLQEAPPVSATNFHLMDCCFLKVENVMCSQ